MMDTKLVYLEKKDYKDILLPLERKKKEEVKSFFREKVFMNSESNAAKENLIDNFHLVKYEQGHHIIKEGDKMKSLFVIRRGDVKLYSHHKKDAKNFGDSAVAIKNYKVDKKIDVAI